jgi:hypothetical protein
MSHEAVSKPIRVELHFKNKKKIQIHSGFVLQPGRYITIGDHHIRARCGEETVYSLYFASWKTMQEIGETIFPGRNCFGYERIKGGPVTSILDATILFAELYDPFLTFLYI